MSLMDYLRVARPSAAADAAASHGVGRRRTGAVVLVVLHAAALAVMVWTEAGLAPRAGFILAWGILNGLALAAVRRPGFAAALSLLVVAIIVLLSRLKYAVLMMTVSFVDVMVVDVDSIRFLFTIFPHLGVAVAAALLVTIPGLIAIWRLDPFRIGRGSALAGLGACLAGLLALSETAPLEDFEAFYGRNHVSGFVRSGVTAVAAFAAHGFLDSDAVAGGRLRPVQDFVCHPTGKPPHIILVHDESSFDIRSAPGIKVPKGYGSHFRSFDGRARKFVVEGAGGPSWYAEYNVLAGLSARSFGRFSYFVTRIAARHVDRGLPNALHNCGYRTFSLYPALGAFMSARDFQTATGVQRFFDAAAMHSHGLEPDRFYYDEATDLIRRERRDGPMFVFVYLGANHFPWTYRYHPERLPDWRDPGNTPEIDEYLRRQQMSFTDYAAFRADLARNFPGESFLIVRFGDHQPDFASFIVDPALDEAGIARRLMAYDPRYFTTYYAIDTINYTPPNVASALDTLEGPYLPLVVQEAAGLPLDPSFAEQEAILARCAGAFYACAGGAEARRFNRLLIDAGLIHGL